MFVVVTLSVGSVKICSGANYPPLFVAVLYVVDWNETASSSSNKTPTTTKKMMFSSDLDSPGGVTMENNTGSILFTGRSGWGVP